MADESSNSRKRTRTTVWRDSEEFRELFSPEKRFKASGTLLLLYAALLALTAIGANIYESSLLDSAREGLPPRLAATVHLPDSIDLPLTLLQVLGFGFALIFLLYVGARYGTARLAFLERVRHEKSVAVEEALATASHSLNIGDLFTLNRRQLDEYHVLSVRQQKQAFQAAQAASIIAFSILVAGALLALSQPSTVQQIVAGTLTALGTTLSAFVAKVFFQSYKSSSDLLKDYYEEPFRTSRILTLQRVVEKGNFPGPERAQAWSKLLETLNADFIRNGGLSPDEQKNTDEASSSETDGKSSEKESGRKP